jgi:sec-independent protein translocase protein TatA
MGSFSVFHWIIVALVVLVLFGRGRISEVMGDFGKGISSFKKGMSEAEKMPEERPMKQIPAQPQAVEPQAEGPAAPARTPEEEAAARRDPGG